MKMVLAHFAFVQSFYLKEVYIMLHYTYYVLHSAVY